MNLKIATVISIMLIFSGCSSTNTSNGANSSTNPTVAPSTQPTIEPTASPTAEPTAAIDPIAEKIANMTLDEKIGQMVLVGLEGTSMQEHSKEMIDSYHVGGFILYKDNITSAAQTLKFLNQLKQANQDNQAALWLSIDQEGGKVSRMPDDFKKLPPAADVGKAANANYTNLIGQALGEEVRALGFNMDFAPVLDINSNPKNPVIGNRSFGAKADTVITHGIVTMKAIQSKQVAAVVKHFPGHGDTSVDSHLDLPVVNKTLDELKGFELLPFEEAIRQGADAIMIAHLLIPKIDPDYPASLSKKMITGLLREELDYNGIVITDDMTMGGITEHFNVGEAAVDSVQAGSDIILIGHDYATQISVLKSLKQAARDDVLSKARLDESVYRILSLKNKYQLKDTATASVDIEAVNHHIQTALQAKKQK
ncbi:beta-N-acetylhexosaminidase [Paenibacillus paridis]|uniref:beta-N-acetylhexosaminidase n=1 Tax=Paenibacillus paridis TaxID=2583376 RepID=UPI001124399D|nr:beta-N-acetylhexosaminidase [Paenibacillus paridis]